MEEGQVVLKVDNLCKNIKKSSIIKNVSFELKRGEILGLLGPNGSGKTTILKMLVGLIKPTAGTIVIGNQSLSNHFEYAIRHIGAIIENPVMYDYLSGYDNLLHFFRMTSEFSYNRIDEVIELLNMEDYIHDKMSTYSLGMKQRVGLAQAILHQPTILLLDEPTNGLDPEGIISLREILKRLARKENVSVIISSHILAEIEMICDSVMVIDQGKSIKTGQMSELNNGDTGKQTYTFTILNKNNVHELLEELCSPYNIQFKDQQFTLDLISTEVAMINKKLVTAGIDVIGIERTSNPLEALFLNTLRGEDK